MKVGDVVELKSGGWKMTISKVEPNSNILGFEKGATAYYCQWHDGQGKSHGSYFSESVLKIAT